MKKVSNILWLDWGEKMVWVAYFNQWANMTMPIGYLYNDSSLLFNLSDVIARYRIKKIVLGVPSEQSTKDKMQNFIEQLAMISDWAEIFFQDEDYSSVEASQVEVKQPWVRNDDVIAAMVILDRWILENWNTKILW